VRGRLFFPSIAENIILLCYNIFMSRFTVWEAGKSTRRVIALLAGLKRDFSLISSPYLTAHTSLKWESKPDWFPKPSANITTDRVIKKMFRLYDRLLLQSIMCLYYTNTHTHARARACLYMPNVLCVLSVSQHVRA